MPTVMMLLEDTYQYEANFSTEKFRPAGHIPLKGVASICHGNPTLSDKAMPVMPKQVVSGPNAPNSCRPSESFLSAGRTDVASRR